MTSRASQTIRQGPFSVHDPASAQNAYMLYNYSNNNYTTPTETGG